MALSKKLGDLFLRPNLLLSVYGGNSLYLSERQDAIVKRQRRELVQIILFVSKCASWRNDLVKIHHYRLTAFFQKNQASGNSCNKLSCFTLLMQHYVNLYNHRIPFFFFFQWKTHNIATLIVSHTHLGKHQTSSLSELTFYDLIPGSFSLCVPMAMDLHHGQLLESENFKKLSAFCSILQHRKDLSFHIPHPLNTCKVSAITRHRARSHVNPNRTHISLLMVPWQSVYKGSALSNFNVQEAITFCLVQLLSFEINANYTFKNIDTYTIISTLNCPAPR